MERNMLNFEGKNPYMDYRNTVPFIDLTGFIPNQPIITDEIPAKSLQEQLMKKKFSTMINLRRLQYCCRVEDYRNGHR